MILNRRNVPIQEQKLFLGPELALQRYDQFKHPVFFELFNKQLGFMWRPEEISLQKDRVDYQSLADHEKHIFTSNLLFQTLMDSVVSRGVNTFSKHITSPELEACFNVWQMFETIHSYSYTYIIKNLYPNPSELLDQALLIPAIQERIDSVCNSYDELENATTDNVKAKIYLALISVNILEAVRFYVSFVCAFAFAENKKMVGNADIIRLIKRDELCLSDDTEVLTQNGWSKISDLSENIKIAQYAKDGSITFVIPNRVIKKEFDGQLVSLKNDCGHVDMLVTPDHRIVYLDINDNIKEQTAEQFKPNYLKKIIVSGKNTGEKENLTDYERFLIALQADGNIHDLELRNGSISGCHTVGFGLTKERKIERLKYILKRLNFEYSESNSGVSGEVKFHIKVPVEYELTKIFNDWITDYSILSFNWCLEFIEEMVHWDGSIRKDTESYYYSSVIESNAVVVQTIAALADYKTYKSIQVDDRCESYSNVHRLSISKNKKNQSGQSLKKKLIDYRGFVYCVSVPSGMFLVKRNDGIFITGNCHLRTTQSIIDILHKSDDEGFVETAKECREQAITMFVKAAEEEKEWAKYLFKDGSILGLNSVILGQYIEWLTDTRMSNIGLPKQFNVKNNGLGGWVTPWLESGSVQVAPQESEITSYRVGASVSDVKNMDFGDIEL